LLQFGIKEFNLIVKLDLEKSARRNQNCN